MHPARPPFSPQDPRHPGVAPRITVGGGERTPVPPFTPPYPYPGATIAPERVTVGGGGTTPLRGIRLPFPATPYPDAPSLNPGRVTVGAGERTRPKKTQDEYNPIQ